MAARRESQHHRILELSAEIRRIEDVLKEEVADPAPDLVRAEEEAQDLKQLAAEFEGDLAELDAEHERIQQRYAEFRSRYSDRR